MDDFVKNYSNSIANALALPQSCTKPSIYILTGVLLSLWHQGIQDALHKARRWLSTHVAYGRHIEHEAIHYHAHQVEVSEPAGKEKK